MKTLPLSPTRKRYAIPDHDTIHGDVRYTLRVRDMPHEEKPREKLSALGPSSLTMAELVSVIWGVGTRKEDVLSMSHRSLKEYGERAILHEMSPEKLAQAVSIPLNKAQQLIAAFELGRRYFDTRGDKPVYIRTSRHAWQYLSDLGGSRKEQLRGLYLNSRFQLIHEETISVGSLTSNIVHPREVFQPAIERGAVAVIIAHNHPSGNSEPSADDREVTEQLRAGGAILGIELLDHLIVTRDTYTSLIEQ